ncbi:bifunctional adenosylcobinamide kinase/adenosylcobinamide-phosphate guanylyltransferase [Yoonia sp. 2307UL14-13]|uniref:bifunctional adenosylcobinamide kinase/adenosylcobinamide-phosphate guanylyltransferase n=1 Tax=Yoonia sp. 2307UL14-13 TaxID=3126506 RepID=UPI0030A3EDF9
MTLPKLTMVLGGAASGKSAFAEALVLQAGISPLYVATAQAFDDEMSVKIRRHQARRGDDWDTVEEPFELATFLGTLDETRIVLIDCATLWLTNIILDHRDIAAETTALISALRVCAAPVVIVSNEVGYGIVPENALARNFRNAQGTLNQSIAAEADRVIAVMAGLPIALKGQL